LLAVRVRLPFLIFVAVIVNIILPHTRADASRKQPTLAHAFVLSLAKRSGAKVQSLGG